MAMGVTGGIVMMVGAALGFGGQFAVEIGGSEVFDRRAGLSGADNDAVLGKEHEGTLSDAAGDDGLHALSRSQRGNRPGACGGGTTVRRPVIFRCSESVSTKVNWRQPPK